MDALDQHIQACLKGDIDRFEEVVKICEPRVRAVLAAMTPDPNAVPDLTQDVFLIAYQRLSSYQPGTNFLAWIRTITRHVAQNDRRRWYRRREMHEQYQPEAERLMAEHIDRFVESLPEATAMPVGRAGATSAITRTRTGRPDATRAESTRERSSR